MPKILFLLLFIISFAAFAQTQEKEEAYKFFEYENITDKLLKEKLEDFRVEIVEKRDNKASGYIINYGKFSGILQAERKLRKNSYQGNCGLDGQICGRITYVRAEDKKRRKTEFWIVPEGAEPPKPE